MKKQAGDIVLDPPNGSELTWLLDPLPGFCKNRTISKFSIKINGNGKCE